MLPYARFILTCSVESAHSTPDVLNLHITRHALVALLLLCVCIVLKHWRDDFSELLAEFVRRGLTFGFGSAALRASTALRERRLVLVACGVVARCRRMLSQQLRHLARQIRSSITRDKRQERTGSIDP